MTVKVQVGPPQIAIHEGQTVLITEEDGQINWPSDKGLECPSPSQVLTR
jgi:hypothetical protein